MSYEEYVKDVFVEHHNAMGMDIEEANELFDENSFDEICKWLEKVGYDLSEFDNMLVE